MCGVETVQSDTGVNNSRPACQSTGRVLKRVRSWYSSNRSKRSDYFAGPEIRAVVLQARSPPDAPPKIFLQTPLLTAMLSFYATHSNVLT